MDEAQTNEDPMLAAALSSLPDHEAALLVVLDAWRTWRSPRLARVVETVSVRLVSALGEVPGLSNDDRRIGWVPMAQQPVAANLGRLLSGLGGSSGRIARKNLLLLSGWPADPRLTARLYDLLLRPRVSGESSRPLWTLVFDVLTAVPDPRTVPILESLVRSPLRFAESLRRPLVRRAISTIDIVQRALRQMPPMPSTEFAILSKLEEQLGLPPATEVGVLPATVEQLRAAVYVAPDDDARRHVFADALMSVGDPLGELIALQLARGRSGPVSDREAGLLREHASAWSGPLALCSRAVRFERGFPASVVLRRPRWHTRRAIPAPEWATIEELDAGELSEDASCIHELLWKAPLPQLRRVRGVSQALAEELLLLRPMVEMVTTD